MKEDNKRILAIVPCYNEEKNIENMIKLLSETPYDFVIVNDGSRDNSLQVIKANKHNCINLPNNLGIGGAVQAGYRFAQQHGYDIAIQVDGDGQHNVDDIRLLVECLENESADMVIGSRFLKEEGFKSTRARLIGIKILSLALKILTGGEVRDITSGFRAVNRDVIKQFAEEYPHEYPEPVTNFQLCQNKKVVKEVAANMNERVHGKSSIGGLDSVYYMMNILLQFVVLTIFKRR